MLRIKFVFSWAKILLLHDSKLLSLEPDCSQQFYQHNLMLSLGYRNQENRVEVFSWSHQITKKTWHWWKCNDSKWQRRGLICKTQIFFFTHSWYVWQELSPALWYDDLNNSHQGGPRLLNVLLASQTQYMQIKIQYLSPLPKFTLLLLLPILAKAPSIPEDINSFFLLLSSSHPKWSLSPYF